MSEVATAALREALAREGLLVGTQGTLPETIAAISDDSRRAGPDSCFVAVRGALRDGHDFLPQVEAAGAAMAIVAEGATTALPAFIVRETRAAAAAAAAAFYGEPAQALQLVGVTGTNGKTTTVGLLRHLLDAPETPSASIGTLGVLLDVSLKVLPAPPAECTLRFDVDEATAIRRLNEWGGQPLPISASAWCDGVLLLRLSGAPAGLAAARTRLGGDRVDDAAAAAAWADVREQQHAFFGLHDDVALWRIAVPPTTPPLGLGRTLIEWHGGQRWLVAGCDAPTVARIRDTASAAGGHATRFRGGDRRVPAFHPLPPVLAALNARLKQAFDPAGIFNVPARAEAR
ncbi:MAG TPA: Mur ligase family protein [Gemmatimonadaceae bacterium]|nr:Mur ligase family protein [Gemmatimonadaceae bacterium]